MVRIGGKSKPQPELPVGARVHVFDSIKELPPVTVVEVPIPFKPDPEPVATLRRMSREQVVEEYGIVPNPIPDWLRKHYEAVAGIEPRGGQSSWDGVASWDGD